jgi:hypothetical protein
LFDYKPAPPVVTELPPASNIPHESTIIVTSDEPPLVEPPNSGFAADAVYARSNVLTGSTALRSYLKEEKSKGFKSVVIEMKDDEGRLLYKSEIEELSAFDEIVTGTLTAAQIVEICLEEGLIPVARVNTLKDHIAPKKLQGIGFVNWLDNKPEEGGKRWSNPFLEGTVEYNANIVRELSEAGFSDIVLANTIFPYFRGKDFTLLPEHETNPATRFSALSDFINAVSDSLGEVGDSKVFLEMNLACFDGGNPAKTSEILKNNADSLRVDGILAVFNREFFDSFNSQEIIPTVEMVVEQGFSMMSRHSGSLEIIPLIDGTGISEKDRDTIENAFISCGFENYTVRN